MHRTRTHQLTDTYLLALAVVDGGRLVTFERGISIEAVPSVSKRHFVILG